MWIPSSQFSWHHFPKVYAEWLQHSGSLTERFRALSRGNLRHNLLFEGWKNLDSHELEPLNIESNSHWTREIIFYGNDHAWEWARTIIPASSLIDEGEAFLHLGNKPIGDILFRDPKLTRSEFEIAQLDHLHPYTKNINTLLHLQNNYLWARRSLLYFYQKPLLIYELFLPAVFVEIENNL